MNSNDVVMCSIKLHSMCYIIFSNVTAKLLSLTINSYCHNMSAEMQWSPTQNGLNQSATWRSMRHIVFINVNKMTCAWLFIRLWSSDGICQYRYGSILVKVMTCLDGTKPLAELMITYQYGAVALHEDDSIGNIKIAITELHLKMTH